MSYWFLLAKPIPTAKLLKKQFHLLWEEHFNEHTEAFY